MTLFLTVMHYKPRYKHLNMEWKFNEIQFPITFESSRRWTLKLSGVLPQNNRIIGCMS